jgi:hypothetical protein
MGVPREEGATCHHEKSIDQTMERLSNEGIEISGRRNPVCNSTNRNTTSLYFLPAANKANPPSPFELSKQDLRKEV